MRSAAIPRRNCRWDSRSFAAVAAASPRTITPLRTLSANTPVTVVIKYRMPAILALRRGEASKSRSVMSFADSSGDLLLILVLRDGDDDLAARVSLLEIPDRVRSLGQG